MALDLADIRTRLSVELATLTGWETYTTWPDNPLPPCVIVQVGDCRYHEAMQAGLAVFDIALVLLVNSVVTDEAQLLLDEYLSSGTGQSKSVIDTLQGSNLNGLCNQVHITGWSEYGAVPMGDDRRMFGAVVTGEVHCTRK